MLTPKGGAHVEENTLEMAKAAAVAALSRKAQNTSILDLREMSGFTDFFVICSGISDIQVEGISEAVLQNLKDKWDARPWHREGERKSDWILLDYVDFVVHIFLDEKREYFNLERLWGEAPTIEVPEVEKSKLILMNTMKILRTMQTKISISAMTKTLMFSSSTGESEG